MIDTGNIYKHSSDMIKVKGLPPSFASNKTVFKNGKGEKHIYVRTLGLYIYSDLVHFMRQLKQI